MSEVRDLKMSVESSVDNVPKKMNVDKTVFWPATIVTLIAGALFFVYPEESNAFLGKVHAFTTNELGWFFLVFTLGLLGLCFYYAFSPMGHIVLGDEGEKPQFSTITWLGMILTSGTGGSLLYLGAIEWIWIMGAPPFGVEANSLDAARWASAYGMFHWGPSAWAFYMAAAIPIGYFFYAKKKRNMKMSEYARPLIGKHADGIAGHSLNFFYIFGLLGGVLTSVALGTPAISSGFAYMLGLDASNIVIDIIVIALWTFIPIIALVLGMKKGLSILSNINLVGFGILIFSILLLGPTWFILNQSSDAMGLMFQNFIKMSLSTDAIGKGGFPQGWTVFYFAWWAVYALPFGLFIAKISKGRTIRQITLGGLTAGSLGCMIFYMVLPNFGLNLQLNGTSDLVTVLAEKGRGGVVIEMFSHAPGGSLMIVLFTMICLLSYITGHTAVGYSLAAASEKRLSNLQDPQKWNMSFWLVLAGIVSLGLYLLNPSALYPLQTISIITGFPICIALVILILSFFKQLNLDFPDGVPFVKSAKEKIYVTAVEE
ncbi:MULTISPECIES: BCCT family transporter [unclassified Fusibacter]|uniref:BCCT family transporter n=1 Tax=unclassified Fusibacter TaxID=2624464 RepID=UPI0019D7180D|nr:MULTISPECIES: BCCT family transporter [unclassified Fusibacter]MCK8058434.1 BCCT family transporter [Fusibacter sp. A2]